PSAGYLDTINDDQGTLAARTAYINTTTAASLVHAGVQCCKIRSITGREYIYLLSGKRPVRAGLAFIDQRRHISRNYFNGVQCGGRLQGLVHKCGIAGADNYTIDTKRLHAGIRDRNIITTRLERLNRIFTVKVRHGTTSDRSALLHTDDRTDHRFLSLIQNGTGDLTNLCLGKYFFVCDADKQQHEE